MKLSKTKKIILLTAGIAILTTSIVTPIVLLNKDEKNKENDVEKLFKILKAKTTQEKIIELSSDASGKIITNNQVKIIEKIKALIGQSNLKELKIEVSMQNDTNISTIPQKITIKLTKNKISKKIKGFSVKKKNTIDEDIQAIKKVFDAKTNHDLIITLPRSSTGNIIGKPTNKNEIIKKLRILIDSSNINGEANHSSLKGTTIDISMSVDAQISTDFQDIIVLISKDGGRTLRTTKTFKVKKVSTPDEDIAAIAEILDAKIGNDLIITLPSDSTENILDNINVIAIREKLRILIDRSNTNGEANHWSLRQTKIDVSIPRGDGQISTTPKYIDLIIGKPSGKSIWIQNKFQIKKA